MMAERPNILLVIADSAQQAVYGCYGNPQVRTPALDQLAREGVCFTQAYTAAPICHPARASLDTGRFPHGHGVLDNVHVPGSYPYRIFPEARSYVAALAELGYRTGYTGQWHLCQSLFDDVIPGAWTAFQAAGLREQLRADRPHHRYFGELDLPPEQDRDAFSVRGAVELLRRYATLGRPWLLQCEFDRPHPPLRLPAPYARCYDPATITAPAGGPSSPRCSIYAQLHGYTLRMVRTTDWKYVYSPYAPEELYDLAADPGEVANRATSEPVHLRRMPALLAEWMAAVGDPELRGAGLVATG